MDKYQDRYMAHQAKKKQTLVELMAQRHSTRMFSDKPLDPSIVDKLKEAVDFCPSSCDRKGAYLHSYTTDRDEKALLGGLLVGGVGWIHRAPLVVLLGADKSAYKENLDYMPYLDLGVIIQQVYLTCTALDLKCCYINPNIREQHQAFFRSSFNYQDNEIYGGAFGIGYQL